MSRTHRNQPLRNQFRHPKTQNERKQARVSNIYYDSEYKVSTRNRYIPTAWDDITASSIYQKRPSLVCTPPNSYTSLLMQKISLPTWQESLILLINQTLRQVLN